MKTLSAATVSVITVLVSIIALTFHAVMPIATAAAPVPAAAPMLVAYTYDEAAAQCLTLTFQYGPAEVDNCLQAAALSWGVAE